MGERTAPMIQPGRRRHPARKASSPRTSCRIVGDQKSQSKADKLNKDKDQYTEAEGTQRNTRISIRGVSLFLHLRQNITIQIMLAARSPST